jgi:hypothetical protein
MAKRRKQLTRRQDAYIVHLENLTGIRTSGAPGSRIQRLQQEAQRQRIPEYRWKPLPVKKTKDPSVARRSKSRKVTVDRSTGDFFVEPTSRKNPSRRAGRDEAAPGDRGSSNPGAS